jgi:hypothetical protein
MRMGIRVGTSITLVALVVFLDLGKLAAQDQLPAPKSATDPTSASVPSPGASPFLGAGDSGALPADLGIKQTVLPPAADAGSGSFFADAEYLLMQPRRRDLDFVLVSPNGAGTPQGDIGSADWHTESGVRIGTGYLFPGEGWEIGAYYTYFHSHGSLAVSAPAGGALYPTLTYPGLIDQVNSAVGTSSLNYQLVDLEVGRSISVTPSFGVCLFSGARLAFIDQGLEAAFDGGDASQALVSNPTSFNGAGIRVGGEAHWIMPWGLSLFSRAAGSIIAGTVRTQLIETNNAGAIVDVNVGEKFDKLIPVIELGIGVEWQYRNLQVSAGYEMTNWFGLVESPDFVNDVAPGKLSTKTSDLSLSGLFVQLQMSF